MANFEDLANEWLQYTERLEQASKETSELRKAKDEIGKQLVAYMKTHQMEDYTTEHGTILFKRQVNKPSSCNKTDLKESLEDADWAKVKDAEQLTEFVFSKLDTKVRESLSRKKVKKAKDTNDPNKKGRKKKSNDDSD